MSARTSQSESIKVTCHPHAHACPQTHAHTTDTNCTHMQNYTNAHTHTHTRTKKQCSPYQHQVFQSTSVTVNANVPEYAKGKGIIRFQLFSLCISLTGAHTPGMSSSAEKVRRKALLFLPMNASLRPLQPWTFILWCAMGTKTHGSDCWQFPLLQPCGLRHAWLQL